MKRALLALAALVVVGVAVGAVLVFLRGDDGADDPEEVPLTGAAAELAAMIEREKGLTYEASYELVADEAGVLPEGIRATVQRWRKDGRAHVYQETERDDGPARTSQFAIEERSITCISELDEPWTCYLIQEEEEGEMAPDPMLGEVVGELRSGWEVSARDAEVGERRARCFTIVSGDQEAEICMSEDAIPLRILTGGIRLEILELAREVDDSAFELPAEVETSG